MKSRAEITSKYAKAYGKARRKDKSTMLDEVVAVTGWSRDNARRRLVAATRPRGSGRQVAKCARKPRAGKFSYDAVKVLQRVWAASGGQCGKYLAVSMLTQFDALERHGELVSGEDRYSPGVRAELLGYVCCLDRPLPQAGQGHRPDPGSDHDRTVGNCCARRSKSAELAMRSRPSRGSSKATLSRTAVPRWLT